MALPYKRRLIAFSPVFVVLVTYSVSVLKDLPLFFCINAIGWMLPLEKVLFYAGDVEPAT